MPGASLFKCSNNGWVLSPLTSILLKRSNEILKLRSQNCLISVLSPFSCLPNWLQGKANTSKPLSLYFLYKSSKPAYCGVKPQALAVFTINSVLPLYWEKSTASFL